MGSSLNMTGTDGFLRVKVKYLHYSGSHCARRYNINKLRIFPA